MTVSVDIEKLKSPTSGQLKLVSERIGKLLRRIRSGMVRSDGKKLTIQNVADISGISKMTIANAEKGRGLSLGTALTLIGIYKGLGYTKVLDLLDEIDGNYIPLGILKKLAEDETLTTSEFVRTVSLFPEQEFEVSYQSCVAITSMGFATRTVIHEHTNIYYAATVSYAKKNPGLDWVIPKQINTVCMNEADESTIEFMDWANDILLKAVKDRPEFKHFLSGTGE